MALTKKSYHGDKTAEADAERNIKVADELVLEQGYATLAQIKKVTNFPIEMIKTMLTDNGWVEKQDGQFIKE